MDNFNHFKRRLKLHRIYWHMSKDFIADSIASFVFCEYRRPQTALEKANYYISGCCDKDTRIRFLQLTQKYVILHSFILLATILGWFSLFAFALWWNVVDECTENVAPASIFLLAIAATLIPWFKAFKKHINEYKEIPQKYSFCFADLDYQEELS